MFSPYSMEATSGVVTISTMTVRAGTQSVIHDFFSSQRDEDKTEHQENRAVIAHSSIHENSRYKEERRGQHR